jgi:hypothetical protein
VGSGLPTWDQLVLAMYYGALSRENLYAFPNYLFAIAEWNLGRRREPAEITARKIRSRYADPAAFLSALHQTLYAGFSGRYANGFALPPGDALRWDNKTLDGVARLCESAAPGVAAGVRSVITYNYDNLLETALADSRPARPIWAGEQAAEPGALPVYHVHGYVPVGLADDPAAGSSGDEIVFTEAQYHRAAQDAYSWANLVQIQALSGGVGLMIGLSLSDRNLRRLLDAVRKTPLRCEQYALLPRPRPVPPTPEELAAIDEKAAGYLQRFRAGAGVKGRESAPREILQILAEVERLDQEQQTRLLEEMGVHPLWYDTHDQIPEAIDYILG